MSWLHARRPSAALAVSVIALIAALSGTAYAGIVLGRNSVGTKQLRNRAVTTAKIHTGAITAVKLKKGLIVPHAQRADVANSAGTAASTRHASSADTATTAGSAAGLTGVNIVRTAAITSPAGTGGTGTVTFGEAACPAGQYVVGGGAYTDGTNGESVNSSWPTRQNAADPVPDAWAVFMNNNPPESDNVFYVYAICVSGSATAGFKGIHGVRGK